MKIIIIEKGIWAAKYAMQASKYGIISKQAQISFTPVKQI